MSKLTGHRSDKKIIDKDILYDLYFNKRYSARICGEHFNTSTTTIYQALRENGFDVRNQSECYTGKRREKNIRKESKTHGLTKTPIYLVWVNMKTRCYNKNVAAYKDYGERGIVVCDEWLTFINFYNDMKDGYSSELQLERIDNNRGYCKENCKWATVSEQGLNKRNNRYETYNGETKTIAEWSRIWGGRPSHFRQRYYTYKWPIEKCMLPSKYSHVNY